MSDLIRKSDAIGAFREEWERIMPRSDRYMVKRSFIVNAIKTIPPADAVERKRGEWISLHNGKWKCSDCGIEVLIYAKGNFCPNCGARMKGADDAQQ